METNAGRTRLKSVATGLPEQLAGLDARAMSPETARTILGLAFDPADTGLVTSLSRKAQEGSLRPDEQAELDDFIRAADALAVLQSRARQALKRLGTRV